MKCIAKAFLGYLCKRSFGTLIVLGSFKNWKSLKATDINGTIRQNLPASFQEIFRQAASQAGNGQTSAGAYTTSGFRWGDEQEQEGKAAEVVALVAKALILIWNEAEALATYQKQNPKTSQEFLDLKRQHT